ncbi:MAG: hypothetical protein N2036_06950, partial [Bryobacteraceae bacterium]|nr:hypothetical protein [Bryobacteraceae bacterium]
TDEGRAEILLTPGAFLRLGEAGAVRMISNRLTAVRVEVVRGAALIDVVELLRDHSLAVLAADAELSILRPGLYRIEASPPRIRVFNGQAEVRAGGQSWSLKSGRELTLASGAWVMAKFDPEKETAPLSRWSRRRAGYIAMANVSAARQAGMMSRSFTGGTWFWNPYFGFATYIPWGDVARSPFGYFYYTPYSVLDVYYPPRRAPAPVWQDRGAFGGGLAGQMPPRSAGTAYTPSAPVSATAPAAPAEGAGSVGTRGGGASGGAVGGTAGGVRAGSGGRGN